MFAWVVALILLTGCDWGREPSVEAGARGVPEAGRLEVRDRLLPPWGPERVTAAEGDRVVALPVPLLDESRTFDGWTHRLATVPADDSEILWSVDVPPGSHLRFGYTATPGPEGGSPPLDLAVEFHGQGEPKTLWSASDRVADLGGAVRRLEIPLTRIAGGGKLVFTASITGDAPATAVVSWENPLLLAPTGKLRPRILLVCIDTLRADHVSPEHMPYLSARLDDAAFFSNAYTNSPWSLPSITTILTGLVPGEHHAGLRTDLGEAETRTNYNARTSPGGIELVIGGRQYRFQMLHNSFSTLQETLAADGYFTGAIHNNGYINQPTRVLQGMDHVHQYQARDAARGSDLALNWLTESKDLDWFLFLHYIDPHQWPVRIPKPLQGRTLDELDEDERQTILEQYGDLVSYTDRHLERIFQALEKSGTLDDTYVVLVADHGERFFEDGVVGSHGGGFQESVVRVPMAIWGPGLGSGVHPTRVSAVDIVPTVLDLLELDDSQERRFGRSLLPIHRGNESEDRTVVSEGVLWSRDHAAWLEGPWKLIWYPRDDVIRLYDLRLGPMKLQDVSGEHPEVVKRLRLSLERHLRRARAHFRDLDYEKTELDEQTLESLKALGYIE